MSHYLRSLETDNTDLASALLAVGIPLDPKVPCRKITGDRGERVSWFFLQRSSCGAYHTAELMLAWDDETWHKRNPEHPFAYLKVMVGNRDMISDYLRESVPLHLIEKNGKLAFISLEAGDSMQKKIFDRLRKG